MGFPKIVYNTPPVTLTFQRGPQAFDCFWELRANDNLATSGLRERVVEGRDIIVELRMGFVKLDPELKDWSDFMKFALDGGQFAFHPNVDISFSFNCVSDDKEFRPQRAARGSSYYAVAALRFRVTPDSSAPVDPALVLRRYNGILT